MSPLTPAFFSGLTLHFAFFITATTTPLPSLASKLFGRSVAENAMKLTTTITSKQSKGKQNPENFIGETPEPLMATIESGTPEQGGEALQTQQTNEEKVEINTVV